MKKLLPFLFLLFGASQFVQAQGTVLVPGDIALLSLQTDNPDDFTFITFVDLDAGTTIYFTDCGTANGGTFNSPVCTEGAVVFVAAAAISAGDIFELGDAQFSTHTDSRITGTMSLATSGDQIIVFQDTDGSGGSDPAQNPTFIFALNLASNAWTGDPADSNQTGLPMGLTDGTSALAVGSGAGVQDEWDNTVFDGSNMPFADIATAKTNIFNTANWDGQNDVTELGYVAQVAFIKSFMNGLLPIELMSFNAKKMDQEVMVSWTTATETNNEYFTIEHSHDGIEFSSFAEVNGAGDSFEPLNYSIMHDRPVSGVNYYRLKQTDFDGQFSFSTVIALNFDGKSSHELTVAPNPFNNEVTVTLLTTFDRDMDIKVFNMLGGLVTADILAKDQNQMNLNLSELDSGIYFLQIGEGENAITHRIAKF